MPALHPLTGYLYQYLVCTGIVLTLPIIPDFECWKATSRVCLVRSLYIFFFDTLFKGQTLDTSFLSLNAHKRIANTNPVHTRYTGTYPPT